MKILLLGDIHGYDLIITKILKDKPDLFNKYDRVIFIGDYVDSFFFSVKHQTHVLKRLIKIKNEYPNIEFLMGNHDAAYLYANATTCSGISPGGRMYYPPYLEQLDLKIAFGIDDWLITHAGLTGWWGNYYLDDAELIKPEITANALNNWIKKDDNAIIHLTELPYSRGSSNRYSKPSPTWAGWRDMTKDAYPFNQIVGHTDLKNLVNGVKEPTTYKTIEDKTIINIDCLDKGYNHHNGLPERLDVLLELDTKTNDYQNIYI